MFISSCVFNGTGCKKVSISQDEEKWLEFGNIGDTFLYKSQLNNIDTFVVTVRDNNDYRDCNLFERGKNQYELNAFSMHMINSLRLCQTKDKEAVFVFQKNVNNQSDSVSYKHFTVFDFRTEGFENFADFDLENIELKTTKRQYDANFFDRTGRQNSNEDGTDIYINSFYWSKSDGLLKYITADGQEFEFLKKY